MNILWSEYRDATIPIGYVNPVCPSSQSRSSQCARSIPYQKVSPAIGIIAGSSIN